MTYTSGMRTVRLATGSGEAVRVVTVVKLTLMDRPRAAERMQKVLALRQKIQAGTYQVPAGEVAEKIFRALLP